MGKSVAQSCGKRWTRKASATGLKHGLPPRDSPPLNRPIPFAFLISLLCTSLTARAMGHLLHCHWHLLRAHLCVPCSLCPTPPASFPFSFSLEEERSRRLAQLNMIRATLSRRSVAAAGATASATASPRVPSSATAPSQHVSPAAEKTTDTAAPMSLPPAAAGADGQKGSTGGAPASPDGKPALAPERTASGVPPAVDSTATSATAPASSSAAAAVEGDATPVPDNPPLVASEPPRFLSPTSPSLPPPAAADPEQAGTVAVRTLPAVGAGAEAAASAVAAAANSEDMDLFAQLEGLQGDLESEVARYGWCGMHRGEEKPIQVLESGEPRAAVHGRVLASHFALMRQRGIRSGRGHRRWYLKPTRLVFFLGLRSLSPSAGMAD